MTTRSNHAQSRMAAGHRGCNRRVSWPVSRGLGREAADMPNQFMKKKNIIALLVVLCLGFSMALLSMRKTTWVAVKNNGTTASVIVYPRGGRHSLAMSIKRAEYGGVTLRPGMSARFPMGFGGELFASRDSGTPNQMIWTGRAKDISVDVNGDDETRMLTQVREL